MSAEKRLLEGKYGNYRLGSLLERTDWCNVYRCWRVSQRSLEREMFAAKEIYLEYANPHVRRQRLGDFDDQAERYIGLRHPNLARVMDYFPFGYFHYSIFEFIPGLRLGQLLDKYLLPVNEGLALNMAFDTATALAFLHSHAPPVVFGDLSPSCIIITPEGQARLTDYGLPRYLWERRPEDPLVGTPGYASPEQSDVDAVLSPLCDIYCLGAVLWHVLTLRSPSGEGLPLAPLRQINPEVSEFTEKFVARCTEVESPRRYQSMDAVLAALLSHDPLMAEKSANPLGYFSRLLQPVATLFRRRGRD